MELGKKILYQTDEVPACLSERDVNTLLQQAEIIKKNGFKPSFWMIDKSASEKNAIETGTYMHSETSVTDFKPVFPKANIRVCQFHVMQAIGRADFYKGDTDAGVGNGGDGESGKVGRRISVPLHARAAIAAAFRRVQRYRGDDGVPWEKSKHLAQFRRAVTDITDRHGISSIRPRILAYFDHCWFRPYWRSKPSFSFTQVCFTLLV